MWPECVAFKAPFFNQHLGLLQGIENLMTDHAVADELMIGCIKETGRDPPEKFGGFFLSGQQSKKRDRSGTNESKKKSCEFS